MKHPVIVKAALVAILSATAGLVAAAPLSASQTLAVTANVSGICRFTAASTPLAFGAIDPSETSDKVVTANVIYRCTKDTISLGVGVTGGLSRTFTTGPIALPYTLAIAGDTGTGTGFGASGGDLTAVVTGTIAATDFGIAPAGAYSENVTLTITP